MRFYNPEAQRLGERAFDALAATRRITPRLYTVTYRAGAGDTLAALAAKSGTSAETFAKINGTTSVEPGRVYAVPMRGQVARPHDVDDPRAAASAIGRGCERRASRPAISDRYSSCGW